MTNFGETSYSKKNFDITFEQDFVSNQQARMEEILHRAGSNALDPQSVVVANIKSDFSHVCIVPMYDIHMFGEGFDLQRFELCSRFLKTTCNAFAFLGGDWYDNANINSKTNSYNSKTNITQSLDGSEFLLSQIKDKILFVIGGNHDGEFGDRVKPSNISPAKESAKKIAQYIPYNALMHINLADKFCFDAFVTHGSMAKNIDELAKKAIKVSARAGCIPDMIFSGHIHQEMSLVKPISVPIKNKNNIVVGYKTKNVRIEILPSFQGKNDYSASKGFDDGYTNAIAYDISYQKNPLYSSSTKDSEFEYLIRVTKFPILKTYSNEYTSFAQRYNQTYAQLDESMLNQKIQKVAKDKNISDAVQNISKALKDISQEL